MEDTTVLRVSAAHRSICVTKMLEIGGQELLGRTFVEAKKNANGYGKHEWPTTQP